MPSEKKQSNKIAPKLELKDPTVHPEINANVKRELDLMRYILYGVAIVMLGIILTTIFALGGIVMSGWAQKEATYQSLNNQVQVQNTQIQALTNQLKNSTVTPK